MDEDNTKQSAVDRARDIINEVQNIRSTIAKVRTAGAVASALPTVIPIVIVIIVIIIVLWLFYTIIDVASPDVADIKTACKVIGYDNISLDCLNDLRDRTGDLLAPDEESKGGIANPNDTYTN